ncbi:MAG: MFS transporter, partial [Micromonosporaceae bacterium]|nr:MFS transporter [Micromonosporaceae bacterium]
MMARRVAAIVMAWAMAAPPPVLAADPVAAGARPDPCSLEEWRIDVQRCLDGLGDVLGNRVACLKAPTPDAPDAGLGGWFAERSDVDRHSGVAGLYTTHGYAGYSYTTYDVGCAATVLHPDYKFETTIANVEFMMAVATVGAANAVRERAWNPGLMWSWADSLVEQATRSLYERVFTVFGVITVAIVGVYLLWRSRQAEMSAAVTTAGWAGLVMLIVTVVAAWPVQSARVADQALVTTLDAIHRAVGPPSATVPPDQCPLTPEACVDHRPPALRGSDTAVHTLLYRNWLRGLLGSADSETAQKYGLALYYARTLSWGEAADRVDAATYRVLVERKSRDWMRVAEQIKAEDPEAYQYLQGIKGMERIGAGFIALISAIMFALFDLTASLLVLLGFLIFRWAVIAAPIIGTIAILRPVSGGFRRLMHSVVAALFNIIVFGTGAAIYLHAVDLIMNTTTIPGWLQVVLVLLCGIVGWLLLRPYRRITQLGGKDPLAAIAAGGLFTRRQAHTDQTTTTAAADTPDRTP